MIAMENRTNRGKLLSAIAIAIMVIAGIGVLAVSDSSNADGEYTNVVTLSGEINYGDAYGTTSNVEMNNSIGAYFDKTTGTYTFFGYLAEQDLTNTDSAFYKLWSDNDTCKYGIAFTISTTSGTQITIGNGTPGTATDNSEECLLYISETSSKEVKVIVGDVTYTFDLSGLEFISLAELESKQIINGDTIDAALSSGNYTLELTQDAYLTDSITAVSNDLTINLNGYNLMSGCRTVQISNNSQSPASTDITINAGNGGSITSNDVIIIAYSTGTLTVNGGTYTSGDYAFVWYAPKVTEEATTAAYFTDATIEGVCGIWLSNGTMDKAVIDGCDITATAIGIYLGTFGDDEDQGATITDSTVRAESTAIEIKSGNVTIEGCTISADSFESSDGTIGSGESGSGLATININNGYVTSGSADLVNVKVNNSTISNAASSTPVQIVVGTVKGTAANADITFNSDCLTADQIALFYSEGNTHKINLNLTDADGGSVITDDVGNTGITEVQASSGNVLVVVSDVTSGTPAELTNGTTLLVSARATYNGDVSVDSTSTVTVNGGTYEGTVTTGVGTSTNTAVFNNVQGTFTVSEGSVYIDGVLQSGTITVTGDVVLSGSVEGTSGNVIIVGSGTANVTVAAGFSVSSNMTIEFRNVSVSSEGPIANDGTVTFTNSSINGTMTVTGGIVSGGVTSGTLILNNAIDFSTGFNLGENARMTVNQGSTITGSFTNNGTVNLYGTIEASATLVNDGTINVLGDGAVEVTTISGEGTINYSSVSSEATLSGELKTRPTFGADQIVTVTDDLTLVSGAKLTIEGTLVIPEGVTVTVQDGAQIILSGQSAIMENSGTVIVQSALNDTTNSNNGGLVLKNGAKVTNDGAVTASYEDETGAATSNIAINVGTSSTFTNNGTLTIAAGSELNVTGSVVNAAEATFTVNGEIYASAISNSGTIAINGTISGTTTISLVAANATVEVVSVQGGALTVNDTGLMVGTTVISGTDSVTITPTTTDYAVRGITVTAVTSTSNNVTTKALSVTGEASYGYVGEDTPAPTVSSNVASMTFTRSISVPETFTVTNYIGVTSNGTLTVSGAMSVYGLTNGGTVTVTGTLDVIGPQISGGTVNAAMYMTEVVGTTTVRTYHYTTLANAIDSGATSITVTGEIDVDTEVTIPSGTTVTFNGDMTVTEDGYVTVANGGRITGTGDIAVEGSLYITVVSSGTRGYSGTITSEVYSTDDTDALYTNLVSAMAAAESGDTIELNGNADLELTTFTIKDGVILDTNNHTLTLNGSTLVINGTLEVDAANQLVLNTYSYPSPSTVEVDSSVVLNGYIRSQAALSCGETYPAGAYYSILENGVPMNYITTVENSATVIGNTVGQTVTVYGDVTVGDVEFVGTVDAPATVIIRGEMEAGTVTLDNATLRIGTSNAVFAGIVTDGNGTIAISDAAYGEGAAFTAAVVNGAERLTVSGQINDADAVDPASVVVTGTIYVNGLNITNMTVDGTVETAGSLTVTEVLTINGTVNVNSGNTLTVNADNSKVYILGDLNVAESTTTASAGTATIATLYIGVDADMVTFEATASGNVQISSMGVAYVSAGSTAPASITNATNVRSTEFYVEDSLFLTAYGFSGSTADMSDISVEDADFVGWDDADGKTRYYVQPDQGQDNANSIPVGTYPALYANIDYNIYTVTVYTDGGIGSVAIDGVLLLNQSGGNEFTTSSPVRAGTHTLTYTLKSGFEGTATMTIDGQQISGDSFTISGDYDGTNIVVINLAGTTPVTPGSGDITVNVPSQDDGMSLTDILLIVLVILILVMAIIVALRLMRS